jgi:hypothetical protein
MTALDLRENDRPVRETRPRCESMYGVFAQFALARACQSPAFAGHDAVAQDNVDRYSPWGRFCGGRRFRDRRIAADRSQHGARQRPR